LSDKYEWQTIYLEWQADNGKEEANALSISLKLMRIFFAMFVLKFNEN